MERLHPSAVVEVEPADIYFPISRRGVSLCPAVRVGEVLEEAGIGVAVGVVQVDGELSMIALKLEPRRVCHYPSLVLADRREVARDDRRRRTEPAKLLRSRSSLIEDIEVGGLHHDIAPIRPVSGLGEPIQRDAYR